MSCRHDLAGSTCSRCYPGTGEVDPGPEECEDNLEGSGAVTREVYLGGGGPLPTPAEPGTTITEAEVWGLARLVWSAWDRKVPVGDGTWSVFPTTLLVRGHVRAPSLEQDGDALLWRRIAEACLRAARVSMVCPCCGRGG